MRKCPGAVSHSPSTRHYPSTGADFVDLDPEVLDPVRCLGIEAGEICEFFSSLLGLRLIALGFPGNNLGKLSWFLIFDPGGLGREWSTTSPACSYQQLGLAFRLRHGVGR